MAEKKGICLALLNILRENTDNKHLMSSHDLIDALFTKYGLIAERRTIYANIRLLKDYGYDISTWGKENDGYALVEHQFSEKEVLVLYNLIEETDQLKKGEKKALRTKLMNTLSEYQQNSVIKKL